MKKGRLPVQNFFLQSMWSTHSRQYLPRGPTKAEQFFFSNFYAYLSPWTSSAASTISCMSSLPTSTLPMSLTTSSAIKTSWALLHCWLCFLCWSKFICFRVFTSSISRFCLYNFRRRLFPIKTLILIVCAYRIRAGPCWTKFYKWCMNMWN